MNFGSAIPAAHTHQAKPLFPAPALALARDHKEIGGKGRGEELIFFLSCPSYYPAIFYELLV
jgi:hypothetical protein